MTPGAIVNANDFKETEMGYIPQEWTVVQLESVVVDFLSGDWGEDNDSTNEGLVGCRVIRGTDFPKVENGSFATVPVRYIKPNSVEKRQVKQDDFLVEISGGSRDQPTGRLWHATNVKLKTADAPVVFTNFVKLLRIDLSSVSSGFFRYAWDYLYAAGKTQIYEKRTTGIRNFKYRDFLANESIPLPPLPEQRAIAHILSTIQRAIAAQDAVIAATREVKRSLMHRLFTYGPYAEPLPTKETEIGEIPERWDAVPFERVCERPEYGYTTSAINDPVGPKFLRITDIQDSSVNWASVPFCECSDKEYAKYQLQSGDILFARIGATTGKTFLVADCPPAVFASYLIRVRTESSLLPDYLSQFTNTDRYWQQIDAVKGGRLKQGINIPVINSLFIPMPSLVEQKEIAHILAVADEKIRTGERRRAALQALFKSMLHQLMTGQVRVPVYHRVEMNRSLVHIGLDESGPLSVKQ